MMVQPAEPAPPVSCCSACSGLKNTRSTTIALIVSSDQLDHQPRAELGVLDRDHRVADVLLQSWRETRAVLIAVAVLGALPIGPGVGAGAMVLILGSTGVAGVTAAGVLLTATGTVGALAYGGWALADRAWTKRRTRLRSRASGTAGRAKPALT
jgi:hypothetical protein